MNNFNNIWNKIIINEGNTFHTIRGKKFKYRINGNVLITNSCYARMKNRI